MPPHEPHEPRRLSMRVKIRITCAICLSAVTCPNNRRDSVSCQFCHQLTVVSSTQHFNVYGAGVKQCCECVVEYTHDVTTEVFRDAKSESPPVKGTVPRIGLILSDSFTSRAQFTLSPIGLIHS